MTTTTITWLHVGDLHVTTGAEQNICDLHEIADQANRHFTDGVDFVFLPGDNANEGRADQYALIRTALAGLRLPLRILPGDHDFEPRTLDAMHDVLGAPALPQAATIAGHRCLFLDIVSAGTGGPDFQLGSAQLAWLERELAAATMPALLFMHAYPRELRDCGERVADLVATHDIACIAMGHTHYNELANDGTTIYSTVRSTGQVEEGPPGFALTSVDDGVVSWRFKQLQAPYPFVLVTSPADERLITDPARQIKSGTLDVRARVWGEAPLRRVTARIGDGPPQELTRSPDASPSRWQGRIEAPDGRQTLIVRAEDEAGSSDEDTVDLFVGDGRDWTAPTRAPAGSDANALGAWAAKGIHGGQLGPNKNGRQW
jgi:hypothetical protein